MADAEDLVEAVFDIEDIVEEVADPEDLVEDFFINPLMVLFAFTAALAGVFLLVLLLGVLVLLALAFGPIEALAFLTVLSFVVFAASVAGFLYVRRGIPSDVYSRVEDALNRADDAPPKDGRMSEKEAIEELKQQYAAGNLDDRELDRALDDALTAENPGTVVDRCREVDRERERE